MYNLIIVHIELSKNLSLDNLSQKKKEFKKLFKNLEFLTKITLKPGILYKDH